VKNIDIIKTYDFLYKLDNDFIQYLDCEQQAILLDYRQSYKLWSQGQISKFIIDFAPLLESFLASKFDIKQDVQTLINSNLQHKPIIAFKKLMVQKAVKKKLEYQASAADFVNLDKWLMQFISDNSDIELVLAKLFLKWQQADAKTNLEKLSNWCWYCYNTTVGQTKVKDWASFKLPVKTDYECLVNVENEEGKLKSQKFRQRQGFGLTDKGMNARELQVEADYCIYCHKNQGDFCKRGFPVKKNQPELGLKLGSLGDVLTGCPLEEKISEMQFLFNEGYSIAALAVIMVDNPLCPATGHRVCNDCMKSCIYQKQTPVNIPQIETGVLNSVLSLPWGVEIYDLLLNWNPLRATNFILAKPNNYKVMVMGLGPAGFTAANQLLMLGYTVVGVDGLKIEPVDEIRYSRAIKDFSTICDNLDVRSVLGFGGVAEYGITVRWNKNYLSLILLVLLRRKQFKVFGGIRFGGTITCDDVWRLGFDHLVLAVGAGLPRELNIPGSLSIGVRAANDFLMALQLSGAHKLSSFTSLEVDLPAVVIGGGLTGIDAATELQAYYLLQIKKVKSHYEKLADIIGESKLRANFADQQLSKLDRWLKHAKQLELEQAKAKPDLVKLIHAWGGVTVVYRKRMEDSPAYKRNHEELIKALEEGLIYLPCFSPIAIRCDEHGYCQSLAVVKMENTEGAWQMSDHEASLAAKTILVATGAQPNVAYGFEHAGDFERKRYQYIAYRWQENNLVASPVKEHCKQDAIGMFTSYNKNNKCVSFIGDTHPVYHGSVVKAIASAMYAVPLIHKQLQKFDRQSNSEDFLSFCTNYFAAKIINKQSVAGGKLILTIKSLAITTKYKPGNFIRLQGFEKYAKESSGIKLYGEAVAQPIFDVDYQAGSFKILLANKLVNEKILSMVAIGDEVSAMGPTGVKAKILSKQVSVLLIVDEELLANLCSVLEGLRVNDNYIIIIIRVNNIDLFFKDYIEKYADYIIWETQQKIENVRAVDCLVDIGCAFDVLLAMLAKQNDVAKNLIDVRLLLNAIRVQAIKSRLPEITAVTNIAFEYCSVAVYGPMQCMLKGVCAQCLQWQIDPLTGERTKAVYACSWQDQPLDLVDVSHLEARHDSFKVMEQMNNMVLEQLAD
jgi:NADPH-dependent glutamate synthase beta subunit-like oxidoreductase/NAD(P)H-flavin reductase